MVSYRKIIRNRLLSLLSQEDFDLIADGLDRVDLPRRFNLSEPDTIGRYSYFLESGLGSIVAVSSEKHRAEIGLFGREGMTPTALVLDAETAPYDIFMQVAGEGYRVESSLLLEILDASLPFRKLLSRYAQAMAIQTSATALSNAVHNVEQRSARWILMAHDRTDGDEIALTHEFLSIMLAVRRPSVTTALHALEGAHLIVAERGLITVKDRKALEVFAGDAYGMAEREYVRLIGAIA